MRAFREAHKQASYTLGVLSQIPQTLFFFFPQAIFLHSVYFPCGAARAFFNSKFSEPPHCLDRIEALPRHHYLRCHFDLTLRGR